MTKPTLEELLASARGDEASPDQLAKLDRKLAPLFVVPPGGGGGPGGHGDPGGGHGPPGGGHGASGGGGVGAAAAGAGVKHAVALKWAAGVLAVAVSTGGIVAVRHYRSREVAVATVGPVAVAAPAPVAPPDAPVETPPPVVVAPVPEPPKPPRPPASAESSLVGESRLLERARSALQTGHAAAALDACEHHAHTYPRGQLREERERIAIEALIALGRHDAAETRATRFDRTFPDSVQSARIHALLDPR